MDKIKEEHNIYEILIALGEMENELNSKKYGFVWEEHEEKVDVQIKCFGYRGVYNGAMRINESY